MYAIELVLDKKIDMPGPRMSGIYTHVCKPIRWNTKKFVLPETIGQGIKWIGIELKSIRTVCFHMTAMKYSV